MNQVRLPRRRRSERGATLITFALCLTAICIVIALVLGGSLGYSAERNSQTASDAAALAATSALRNVQTAGAATSTVEDAARATVEANGSDTFVEADCEIIDANLAFIATCGSATAGQMAGASGVRMNARDTRDVPFGEVAGQPTITGETGAAATIQPLASGNSPFMLCNPAPGHPTPVIDASGNIRPEAIGQEYVLQGNPMKEAGRDCGNPASNWRGWVEFEETFAIPGFWGVESGNKNGHIDKQLVDSNACGGQGTDVNDFVGCVLAVPICTYGNDTGGGNFEVYCVTFGSFEITHNGNGPSSCYAGNQKHICGEFLGAAVATGGQGGGGPADPNEVVVIKLVE